MSEFNGQFFADWLRKKAAAKGLNQSELARRSGVARATINNYWHRRDQILTGRPSQPGLELVERLSVVLDTGLDDARMAAGYDLAPETDEFDSEGLFRGIEKLSPEKRRLAERQIKAIIDSLAEEEDLDFDYIEE